MLILFSIKSIFTFWTLGAPAVYVIPLLLAGFFALQFFVFSRRSRPWRTPVLLLAAAVLCEGYVWLTDDPLGLSLGLIVGIALLMSAAVGAALGLLARVILSLWARARRGDG